MYQVYQNMFARQQKLPDGRPSAQRQSIRHWSQDPRRNVDQVQTPPDIDHDRIAYCSLRLGSAYTSVFLAVEPRFRCAMLMTRALPSCLWSLDLKPLRLPPRIDAPPLLLNGTHDSGLR